MGNMSTSPYILIVGLLIIQSSFIENYEKEAENVPDTVQFWLTNESAWRIRTYAPDHDIHIYSMNYLAP